MSEPKKTLVEGLKVEEGSKPGSDASFQAFSEYVKKLCVVLDEAGIETDEIDCDLHNLAENIRAKQMLSTLIAQPAAAQHLKREQEPAPRDPRDLLPRCKTCNTELRHDNVSGYCKRTR